MTLENKLKSIVADLVFQVASLQTQIEELKAKEDKTNG